MALRIVRSKFSPKQNQPAGRVRTTPREEALPVYVGGPEPPRGSLSAWNIGEKPGSPRRDSRRSGRAKADRANNSGFHHRSGGIDPAD